MNFFERIGISLALLFLALFACHSVATYNTRWHFSRFGLPETLVAADGVSYPDGKPISPPTLRAYRSGQEAMEWAILMPCFIVAPIIIGCEVWEQHQDAKRLEQQGQAEGVLVDGPVELV